MEENSSNILEVYYDHYKDTNELRLAAEKRRNKGFAILCILEAVSFLMTLNCDFICGLLNDVVRSKVEATVQIGSSVLQTMIWILIAYVLVRYTQDQINIERLYKYQTSLEEKIAGLLKENAFGREGKDYLNDYPPVLNLIHLFYNLFCPMLFTTVNIYHLVLEWVRGNNMFAVLIDTLILIAVLTIILFLFLEMNRTIRNQLLEIKPIRKIAETIKNKLKEV